MNRLLLCLAALVLLGTASQSFAGDPAPKSRHQMMKECMAKEKASDAGMPKEQMKQNCKDVTSTEKENADQSKEVADESAAPKAPAKP